MTHSVQHFRDVLAALTWRDQAPPLDPGAGVRALIDSIDAITLPRPPEVLEWQADLDGHRPAPLQGASRTPGRW